METNKLLASATRSASRFRDQTSDDVVVLFQRGVDRSQLPLDLRTIDRILEAVETSISRRKLLSARRTIDDTVERLKPCSGSISGRLSAFLGETVGDVAQDSRSIGDQWRDLLAEVQRVNHLQGDLSTVSSVVTLIESSGATKWAEILKTCPPDGSGDPHVPAHALESWRFRRLEAYLKSIDGRSHLAKLSERRADLTHRLERTMSEVVQLRTFIGLHKRMQGGRRTALTQFLNAIRQIGAGTGVSARRYRGDARAAMLECMEAVPCWIMPTWRVSESLPATLGAFDLVIVDEASQSDVMALPALLRAKKVLVVGDNRQVSPSPIGLEERKLLQLRHSYLQEQPFADMLMPGTSLYDLAQAVFPGGRILLNEHFRCVEPIIRFSLQFYSEEIVPLRIPKPSERLDPPLVDVFVRNGCRDGNKVNKAEAIAIVNEIELLVNDPTYRERSIGVVSLIGNRQANVIQNLLLERIGEDAFLRHRIACGDAATFQGKERDIMFLSMIASPGNAHAQVSRLFEQRFNVALSRAKDRMYLFRSVQTEDLRNPQDLKLRVINHFRNPMPAGREQLDDLSALCESDFEQEVFRRLVNFGYRVTPQVAVGDFRIDLVVDGDNDRRLAIELDGDRFHGPDRWFEDYTRQKTLERVGWRFWRCWASSFSLDPEGCLADLVALLREMKIEAIGQGEARHRFTEHRAVDTDELPSLAFDDQEDGAEAMAHIGDKVVVAFATDPNRHYLLTLSDDNEDLVNGVVSVRSATGTALLGTSAEDEVELVWKGETCSAVVLQINKTIGAANVDLSTGNLDPQDVFGQLDRDQSPVEVGSEAESTSEWSDPPTANTNSRDRQMETAAPEVAATPPQPTPTATQLDSWEMTLAEWKQKCAELRERGDDDGLRAIGGHGKDFAHRYRVQQALKKGKAVPKRVLADYPELLSPNDSKQQELFDDD